MVYVTYVISACICATAMIFLFRKVFGSDEFILTIVNCVTLTYDFETQGHLMVYVTFVISGQLYVSYHNDFFVLSGFHIKKFILTIATCCDHHV